MAKPGEVRWLRGCGGWRKTLTALTVLGTRGGHDEEGGYCTNSGTCVLVSCYMEALGKVLMRGTSGPGSMLSLEVRSWLS
jgi:hypothetical protein